MALRVPWSPLGHRSSGLPCLLACLQCVCNAPAMTNEMDPMVPLSTRVPKSLLKQTRLAALMAETQMQDLVREALEQWHTRNGTPPPS